jgi:hypothetical protein
VQPRRSGITACRVTFWHRVVAAATTHAKSQWCASENSRHGSVELTETPEARCERDVRDGKVCVVQHPARDVGATQPSELIRSDPSVGLEQTAETSWGDAEARGEPRSAVDIENTVEDQLHTEADDLMISRFSCARCGLLRG